MAITACAIWVGQDQDAILVSFSLLIISTVCGEREKMVCLGMVCRKRCWEGCREMKSVLRKVCRDG